MYLVLLGLPVVGKGTQAERIVEELKLPHVASGDLYRENLREETELGLLAKEYMDKGDLVPDNVTISKVRERLEQPDSDQGIILDGFPRTLAQAEGLNEILQSKGCNLDGVLYIAVPDQDLVRRLSGRRICVQCQTTFHTYFHPPVNEGVCDVCGGRLYQRDDNKQKIVRARLKVYRGQTAPLIDYYYQADLSLEVDGSGDIETVGAALLEAARSLERLRQSERGNENPIENCMRTETRPR